MADDNRNDEQVHFVDEVVLEEPSGQGAAADHLELPSRPGFQLLNGGREIAGEEGRAGPLRVGERVRRDVLRLRVQGADNRILEIAPHAPIAGEEVVGAAAEQERVGALVGLVVPRHRVAVELRPGPSAVVLYHSVDGDLLVGRQLHEFVLS